jgi:hypothetical protein
MRRTAHARIFSARQRQTPAALVGKALKTARRACAAASPAAALEALTQLVSDYTPSDAAISTAEGLDTNRSQDSAA